MLRLVKEPAGLAWLQVYWSSAMSTVLAKSSERIFYTKKLQWFSQCSRQFSSEGRNDPKGTQVLPEVPDSPKEPLHSWLNIRAGIFGPLDQRLPLPGDVGLTQLLELTKLASQRHNPPSDILTAFTNHEAQMQAFSQIVNAKEENTELEGNSEEALYASMTLPSDILECKVQQCPELVKKDFLELFPGHNLQSTPLAVMTLSQKTNFDMSGWSEEMELERTELTEYFIMAAEEICNLLRSEGYWADFIDPCSGRPYLGDFTSATFFETDERYRYLGFRIEDLGCCKVISHRLWGTHVFVGAIFTNAPVNSEVLEVAKTKINKGPKNT